jgi:proline iminopeptidase
MSFADFAAFRRTQAAPPHLTRREVLVRGLTFAVYASQPVPDVPPLVCVNGGLLFDHKLLWPSLSPLAAGRQIILYDQRGRGRTQAPPGIRAARYEHDIGDLVALRTALGIDRWDIAGHSWGGGIAMMAAAQDPSAVRRLLLIDPVGPTSAWRGALIRNARARLTGERLAEFDAALEALRHDDSIVAHSRYAQALYPAWFHDVTFPDAFNSPRATSDTGASVATKLYRDGYDFTDALRGLATPTLLVHGRDDILPIEQSQQLSALLANIHLEYIDACGHMPFWEQPARFFALGLDFLRAADAPAAPQAPRAAHAP